MEFVNGFIKSNGYAYTIFGRRRNLPDVYSRDISVVNRSLRQGLNFTIQSAASDILLCSLIGLHNKLVCTGMESRIVATVHDSIELICPKEELDDVCSLIYNELVEYPNIKEKFNIHLDVPLAIDIEYGESFGEGIPYTMKEAV